MQDYQLEFIKFAIANNVLCFGDFTLKSGRNSPYFFNSGLFNTGAALSRLGYFYACTIQDTNIDYDMLFGPAYKGIPLVSSIAITLAEKFNRDLPYSFNRKEDKDHGEGGTTFGAIIKGKVLIIDDVISAGASINTSVDIIRQSGAKPVGAVIAMDRQERGEGQYSAVQEAEQNHGINVTSIITLDMLLEYLGSMPDMSKFLDKIRQYREQYGAIIS